MRSSGICAVGIAVASAACGGSSNPPPVTPASAASESPRPPERRPIRLSYLAPSDCPGVDGFLSHVRARSSSVQLEEREGADAGDSVDVRLDPDLAESGWLGELRIEGSLPLEREVRGQRCDDVVAALALITVLRLEGADMSSGAPAGTRGAASAAAGTTGAAATASATASTPATPASPTPATPPSPTPATPPSAVPAAPPAAASPETPQTPEPEPVQPATPEPAPDTEAPAPPTGETPSSPSSPAATSAAAGAAAAGTAASAAGTTSAEDTTRGSTSGRTTGTADSEPLPLKPDEPVIVSSPVERAEPGPSDASPEPGEPLQVRWVPALALLLGYASVPGHALEVTLEGEIRYGDGLSSWASPLSIAFARGDETFDAADLDIMLLTAQLGLCPPAPLAESWAWLRVCANVRAGAVNVHISPRIAEVGEDSVPRPWLAVAPSLQLGIPITERWTLRGGAELAVQLVRDTFGPPLDASEDPEFLPLYRPEAVSVEAGIGVGYGF